MTVGDLVGLARWTTGSTGSGKSAQVLSEELQLLGREMPWTLLHLDAKSESARWLTEAFLPGMVSHWTPQEQTMFLDSYAVINPFDPDNLPALNVLLEPGHTSTTLHAHTITRLIAETVSAQGATLGVRMTTILHHALCLALELGGLSLLEVRALLTNSAYLDAALRFCHDDEVRAYFLHRWPKERADSVHAVVARLDFLLMLDDTRRALCAPSCLDLAARLEEGVTIIDLGSPPRGAESVGQFWLGVFVRGLARAIMGRPMTLTSHPVFCIMDEWWTAIDDDLAGHFERLLTLARFKRVGLWLVNQLPGQIGARFPELLATLKNSCGIQIAFRQSFEDAQRLAYMLPASDLVRVPREPGSPAWDTRYARHDELRRLRVEELSRLPDREFWFYNKRSGAEAIRLRSLDVPFEEFTARAASADPEILRLCRGHGTGISRQRLDEVIARRHAHIAAVAQRTASTARPDLDPRPASISAVPGPPSPPVEATPRKREATLATPASRSAPPAVSTPAPTPSHPAHAEAIPEAPPAVAARLTPDEDEPFLG